MKKYISFFIAIALACSLVSCTATYTVRERPREVIFTRPMAPSPNHVWISGDWVWNGGRYEWREGYWDLRRERARWVEGYWQETGRGWRWHRGHWQKW